MTTNEDTHSLIAFLTARLDEDEAAARRASPGPWQYGDVDSVAGGSLYDTTRMIGSVHYEQATDHDGTVVRHLLSPEADANGEHIARWDPSRVLADVAVKREVLAEAADHGPCTYTGSAMTCLHEDAFYREVATRCPDVDWMPPMSIYTISGGPLTIQLTRALAEVAAKRAILDYALQCMANDDAEHGCGCTADEIAAGQCRAFDPADDIALRALASVYADHPDYRPEWGPR